MVSGEEILLKTPCGILLVRHMAWATTATSYCLLNVALNYYNAYIFGSSAFQRNLEVPIFYTFVTFCLGVCVWTPVLFCAASASRISASMTHGASPRNLASSALSCSASRSV